MNGTLFTSETRFDWNGELGNWSYERVSADVGKITQTYDEDGNDPNTYREELVLNFTAERSGSFNYYEYTNNQETESSSGGFGLPFTWVVPPSETTWYAGANELDDGWRYLDWFKAFKPVSDNWIYHARHGWSYTIAGDTSSLFLWDPALGRWLWTSETVYPWMYAFGPDAGWLFFFENGSPGDRSFGRGDTGEVVSEQDLTVED